ncbi:hypothetical protein GQ44DRAFT_706195 [Phaeosphaeriaceae sp. PMI808]|nr:hypothetical protein GQ44DRAFT_706195 [Phaeosphaeriaceae sp. PMI808]
MLQFNKEVDEGVIDRFDVVLKQLETPMIKYLLKKRVKFRILSIQLMVLGLTEDVAKPWIVVRCPHSAKNSVQNFLCGDFAKFICQGHQPSQINFEITVSGQPLKATTSKIHDNVFIEQVTNSGLACYATMGGSVCIVDAHGKKTFYGLTAGHVSTPDELFDDEFETSSEHETDDSDDSDEQSSSGTDLVISTTESSPGVKKSCELDESAEEAVGVFLDRHWTPLGYLSSASYSSRARDRDWALIEFTVPESGRSDRTKTLSARVYEAARSNGDLNAVIGNESMASCRISKLPARAILPSGRKFVDLHILQPIGNEVSPKGSSGSWVVDAGYTIFKDVYGALVAADPFGSLWMVPMPDILQDIREHFNAVEVTLTDSDGNKERCDDSVTETGYMETLNGKRVRFTLDDDTNHQEDNITTSDSNFVGTSIKAQSIQKATPLGAYNAASITKRGRTILWFCSNCGDGPSCSWQGQCPMCAHVRCTSCVAEEA